MDAFINALDPGWAASVDRSWLTALAAELARAPATYPDIAVDSDAFLRHVAQLVRGMETRGSVRCSDLFLAYASGIGNAQALRIFELEQMSTVPAFLSKYRLDREQLVEVLQRIRERLFVAEAEPPRILSYSGQGPLGGWLRMVAVRAAVDFLREQGRELEPQPLAGVEVGPELALAKARHAEQFGAAIKAALAELPDRDATLLQLRYAQGMEAPNIAAIYRVNPRTIQRWLAEAHEAVRRSVKKNLSQGGFVSERDLDSLLRLVQSQLDLTLSDLLRPSP